MSKVLQREAKMWTLTVDLSGRTMTSGDLFRLPEVYQKNDVPSVLK